MASVWHGKQSILLVSHMPLVGRLCQYLCPQAAIYGLNVAGFVRLALNSDTLNSELVFDGSGGIHGSL